MKINSLLLCVMLGSCSTYNPPPIAKTMRSTITPIQINIKHERLSAYDPRFKSLILINKTKPLAVAYSNKINEVYLQIIKTKLIKLGFSSLDYQAKDNLDNYILLFSIKE